MRHTPSLIENEEASQFARLATPEQNTVETDNDEFGKRCLDLIGRQGKQREHESLIEHGLERHGKFVGLRKKTEFEQWRDAVEETDGLRILRFLLLLQNLNHVVKAWRPDRIGVDPPLGIESAPLESLLHGFAKNRGLPVSQPEHALQDTRDRENVLDRLRLAILAGTWHERVEWNAVAANIVHFQPDSLHETPLGVVVLEIEDADREPHRRHAVYENIQRLRLA